MPFQTPFRFNQPADLDLSIIIVSFNTRSILLDCLRSVRNQTRDLSYEIIVIDNNSSDGSPGAAREKFPDIHLIENDENLGFSAACNQGIRISRGRYTALLNSDTMLEENCFLQIVSYLDKNPGFSILSPQILDSQGNPCPMRLWEDTPCDALLKILNLYQPEHEFRKMRAVKTGEVEVVGGSCFVIRRTLFETIGLLDENHFLYNEEDDFCRRARRQGMKVGYYPETSVKHLAGKSTHQEQNRGRVILETYRSNLYFYSKYYSKSWNVILRAVYRFTLILGIARSLVRRLTGTSTTGADDSIELKLKLLLNGWQQDRTPG